MTDNFLPFLNGSQGLNQPFNAADANGSQRISLTAQAAWQPFRLPLALVALTGLGTALIWLLNRKERLDEPLEPAQLKEEVEPSDEEVRRVMKYMGRKSGRARLMYRGDKPLD
ncbi:MAG TPA: hypothetical protein VHP58_00975 [Alphaproteobacteria bacterium]|nr:hypothetical protein [Alphaproteobacteria bacterium]